MPTELLSIGYPHSMIQNQIYALPGRKCMLFTDTGAATLFQSNDLAFTASEAITLVGGQAEVAGRFIRCTSAGPILVEIKGA